MEGVVVRMIRAFMCACLLGAMVVAPVAAVPPETERIEINDVGLLDEGLTDLCGFDVWVDGSGHITFRRFIDTEGNPTHEVNNFAIQVRYYSEFGEVRTRDIGPDRVWFLDDGNRIVYITGNIQVINAKGEGRLWSNNGWVKVLVTVDENGEDIAFDVIATAGPHSDEDAGLIACELLGPG